MFRRLVAGLVLASATLAVAPVYAGSAASVGMTYGAEQSLLQLTHSRYHSLSPREVGRVLRRLGYHEIRIIDRRSRAYTVAAENHRGHDVILQVSARTGAVLSVRYLGKRRRGGDWGDHDWRGPGHGGRDRGWHERVPRPDHDRPRCWLPEGCY